MGTPSLSDILAHFSHFFRHCAGFQKGNNFSNTMTLPEQDAHNKKIIKITASGTFDLPIFVEMVAIFIR